MVSSLQIRWTTGLVSRKDKRADFNAPAIQRMIDAGAIVLGEADL